MAREFAPRLGQLEQVVDRRQQLAVVPRLGEVVGGAGLDQVDRRFQLRPRGQQDHRQVGMARADLARTARCLPRPRWCRRGSSCPGPRGRTARAPAARARPPATSPRSVPMSCSENSISSAVATAGLSSMTRTLGIGSQGEARAIIAAWWRRPPRCRRIRWHGSGRDGRPRLGAGVQRPPITRCAWRPPAAPPRRVARGRAPTPGRAATARPRRPAGRSPAGAATRTCPSAAG